MIDKLLRRRDRKRRIALPELMERVHQIRKQGYVFSKHRITWVGVIGMLLPMRRHGRTHAIGVGGPVDWLEPKKRLSEQARGGIARVLENAK